MVSSSGAGAGVPGGRAPRGGASSWAVEPLPVAQPLAAAPLVLDGRLVVRDDGDDAALEEGRQTQSHGVDLGGKEAQFTLRVMA